jgi:hypothetical protein
MVTGLSKLNFAGLVVAYGSQYAEHQVAVAIAIDLVVAPFYVGCSSAFTSVGTVLASGVRQRQRHAVLHGTIRYRGLCRGSQEV